MSVKHDYMRNSNTRSVLNFIRVHGAATRREIQAATGLSWGAVSTIISEQLALEQLIENKPTVHAGRQPGELDFNLSKNLSIGAEINIEGITLVLVDVRNNILVQKVELLEVPEKDAVIGQLKRMIHELLVENQLSKDQLLGIGIAVQGLVDITGSISHYNNYIENWRNVPLKRIFEKEFGLLVSVIHDPICMALAQEWKEPRLRGEDFVLIRLAYGIGMCYIHEGKPVLGTEGFAGELGHMVIDANGSQCTCGNKGCFESYCSIRGIAKRLYELQVTSPDSSIQHYSDSDVSYLNQLIVDGINEAHQGNKNIQKVFNEVGSYLGQGIVNIIHILNPRYIVLTGAVMDAADLFLDITKASIRKKLCFKSKVELLTVQNSRYNASFGAALKFINTSFDGD